MAVYGYSGPNNLHPELAKYLFSQQPVPCSRNYNREGHDMPAPSGSPWNPQGVPWGMPSPPQLVQFSGQNVTPHQTISVPMSQTTLYNQLYPAQVIPSSLPTVYPSIPMQSSHTSTPMTCKRKSSDPEPPVIPPKQLITEEKMAAHFSGLNISENYEEFKPSNQHQERMEMMEETTKINLPHIKNLKGHKLVLSDELKKLQEEPLLPASLIERLEKPCMSLVVWKPKEEIEIAKKLMQEQKNKQAQDDIEDIIIEETNKERIGVLVSEPEMSEIVPRVSKLEPAPSVMDVEM